jgi:predicted PurR-regulated permease PerM
LYLLVALVISAILRPITDQVNDIEIFHIKIPRILAVVVAFLILALIPFFFILLFVPLISDQISLLQKLDYNAVLTNLQQPIESTENFILKNFPTDKHSGFLRQEINKSIIGFVEGLDVGSVLNEVLRFTGSILFYLIAVSFITFFFLYEKGLFRRNLLALIPNQYFEVAVTTFYKIEKLLSNYLIGLLGQMTVMFMMISIGLSIMGIKYTLTIAAFMAVINLIPYLGPALGCIFASLVILSTPSEAGSFTGNGFVILQASPIFLGAIFFDNIFVQPFIFSKSVKAHPLEIFLAVFAGATLAGGLGMIAAIPVYTIVRVSYIELSKSYRQYRVFKAGSVFR